MPDHLLTHPDREADDLVAALSRAEIAVGPEASSERTVLDTFDGRLHAAGLRLELRTGVTTELVLVDRSGAPSAHLPVDGAPLCANDLPNGPFSARVAAVAGGRALLPALQLSSRVRTGHRRDRRAKATVTVEVHTRLAVPGGRPATAELPGLGGGGPRRRRSRCRSAAGDRPPRRPRLLDPTGRSRHPRRRRRRGAAGGSHREPHGAAGSGRAGPRGVPAGAPQPDRHHRGQPARDHRDVDPEFLHELRVAVRRAAISVRPGRRACCPTTFGPATAPSSAGLAG